MAATITNASAMRMPAPRNHALVASAELTASVTMENANVKCC